MAVPDPNDWWGQRNWITWFRAPNQRRQRSQINREVVERWLASVAFCFCFASLGPGHLILTVLPALLFVAASASLIMAALRGDHPLSPHLTGWDEGVLSLLLSLGLSLFLRGFPGGP